MPGCSIFHAAMQRDGQNQLRILFPERIPNQLSIPSPSNWINQFLNLA
jgi:hypothetical protein